MGIEKVAEQLKSFLSDSDGHVSSPLSWSKAELHQYLTTQRDWAFTSSHSLQLRNMKSCRTIAGIGYTVLYTTWHLTLRDFKAEVVNRCRATVGSWAHDLRQRNSCSSFFLSHLINQPHKTFGDFSKDYYISFFNHFVCLRCWWKREPPKGLPVHLFIQIT